MIDVTVKVPEDRVAEFYSMFGAWLSTPFGGSTGEPDTGGRHPWAPSDQELARSVWNKLSPQAKSLFTTLIDHSGQKFSGTELAERVGIANGRHGVAGVLAWPGRYCVASDRKLMWEWEYPDGEQAVYWLASETADLFRKAAGK